MKKTAQFKENNNENKPKFPSEKEVAKEGGKQCIYAMELQGWEKCYKWLKSKLT